MTSAAARYVGAFAVVAAIFGCHLGSSGHGPAAIPSLNDLIPEADPGPKANLDYGGSVIPVDLARTYSGGVEKIDAQFQGHPFEHEEYSRTPTAFSLVATSDEQFSPPIPLIVDAHQPQTWSGSFTSGGIVHKATATINLSVGTLPIGVKKVDTVVSTVELSIESGGPTPAKRTLKFMFVKGRGLVQREFSAGVKRLPVE